MNTKSNLTRLHNNYKKKYLTDCSAFSSSQEEFSLPEYNNTKPYHKKIFLTDSEYEELSSHHLFYLESEIMANHFAEQQIIFKSSHSPDKQDNSKDDKEEGQGNADINGLIRPRANCEEDDKLDLISKRLPKGGQGFK